MRREQDIAVALADQIASRLLPLVPRGITVSAEGARVVLTARNGGSRELADVLWFLEEGLGPEEIGHAVERILNFAQDFISIETRMPWPPDTSGAGRFLLPGAEVTGTKVELWYGSHPDAAVVLEPFELEA